MQKMDATVKSSLDENFCIHNAGVCERTARFYGDRRVDHEVHIFVADVHYE